MYLSICEGLSVISLHCSPLAAFNKLLNHVCVSRGSCYRVCRSAKGKQRPNRVGETLSVIRRLFNQSKQTRRSIEKPIWGLRLCRRNRDISEFSSSPLLSRGLKRDPSPFDAQSLHFPQDFDTKLAKKLQACKKITALEDSKWGLMDGAYGNYALIYLLGRGD